MVRIVERLETFTLYVQIQDHDTFTAFSRSWFENERISEKFHRPILIALEKNLIKEFCFITQDSSENVNELKQFFDINYSQIYFIFYESFVNVEANIKQKLNKLNQEELQTVLYVFQVKINKVNIQKIFSN